MIGTMTTSQASATSADKPEPDFSSVHTTNFPGLLRDLGISLVVSTYQAGKVIILREQNGALNTHFCQFASPMGVAFDPLTQKMAIGTRHQVWELRNHPRVSEKLTPPGLADAVFLPRHIHFTGDIRIHDVAWIEDELWAVNTRFSCLCTFDRENSFVPRWQPPFISELAAEDRCHLNGLAVEHGQPKLVTLLARTNTAGGWRNHKRDGGCVWDIPTNSPLAQGLSMPHSPRLHEHRIWFLESGKGLFSTLDASSGKVTEIVSLPGFTRGLAFAGPYAFVGLSQIRESAIFGGIPIAEVKSERACGVWVVDTRTGKIAAFLRFEGVVQEIFSVEILPKLKHPEMINEPGKILDSSFVLPEKS
jgi:uncharacterized protein (TIGR03032 family)